MPGTKGNTNANSGRVIRDALHKFNVKNPGTQKNIIKKLVQMAEDGDMAAIKEYFDRTEGKAVQGISNESEQAWHITVNK